MRVAQQGQQGPDLVELQVARLRGASLEIDAGVPPRDCVVVGHHQEGCKMKDKG